MRYLVFASLVSTFSLVGCSSDEQSFADAAEQYDQQWHAVAVGESLRLDVDFGHQHKDLDVVWSVLDNNSVASFEAIDHDSANIVVNKAGLYSVIATITNFNSSKTQQINLYAGNGKQGAVLTDTTWGLSDSQFY